MPGTNMTSSRYPLLLDAADSGSAYDVLMAVSKLDQPYLHLYMFQGTPEGEEIIKALGDCTGCPGMKETILEYVGMELESSGEMERAVEIANALSDARMQEKVRKYPEIREAAADAVFMTGDGESASLVGSLTSHYRKDIALVANAVRDVLHLCEDKPEYLEAVINALLDERVYRQKRSKRFKVMLPGIVRVVINGNGSELLDTAINEALELSGDELKEFMGKVIREAEYYADNGDDY